MGLHVLDWAVDPHWEAISGNELPLDPSSLNTSACFQPPPRLQYLSIWGFTTNLFIFSYTRPYLLSVFGFKEVISMLPT